MRIIDLYQEHECLHEANLKQLYTKSLNETPKMAQKGQNLSGRVRYFGLSKDGTLNFKVASQSQPGRFYYVYIEAPDILRLGDIVDSGEHLKESDLITLLTMNNFRVHCGCPAWLYWAFQYMATQGNYEIEPETRAPKRNNTTLQGSICKHLFAVVKNVYENKQMRQAIVKDIDNYLRMLTGLDYEDYQQLNHAKQIQQQNRSVKWKNKPSDYMNDYFARKAKNHAFLDDHDIKKSLKREMNKFITANPQSNVDDFLRSYFQMTQKAFADDMQIPEDSVIDYFNELGFDEKKEKIITKRAEKAGLNSGILTKDSEQNLEEKLNFPTKDQLINTVNKLSTSDLDSIVSEFHLIGYYMEDKSKKRQFIIDVINNCYKEGKGSHYQINNDLQIVNSILYKDYTGINKQFLQEYANAYSVTEEELNNNPCYISTYHNNPETGELINYKTEFNNISEVFTYIRQCGGFNQFTDYGSIKYYICSDYKGGEFYYVRNPLALGGWCWEDCNGSKVKFQYNRRIQKQKQDDDFKESDLWKSLIPAIEDDESDRRGVDMYIEKIKNGEHRPVLINDDGDILDGNHTMTAYQTLNIKPPLLYKGTRKDFYEALPKVKCDAQEAIKYMIDNGTATLVETERFNLVSNIKYILSQVTPKGTHVGYIKWFAKSKANIQLIKDDVSINITYEKGYLNFGSDIKVPIRDDMYTYLDARREVEPHLNNRFAKAKRDKPRDDIKQIQFDFKESEQKSYLTPKEAHAKYQEYLTGHIGNVIDAVDLIIKHCDDNEFIQEEAETLRNIAKDHDKSKYSSAEYIPYLHHFYPTKREEELMSEEFECACKHHTATNKHHWDFWLDPNTLELRDIPDQDRDYKLYCVERVADWLAMACQHNEDKSLWYDINKASIKMPAWAYDFIEYIYSKVPDDYYLSLSYNGTRGKLDESEDEM